MGFATSMRHQGRLRGTGAACGVCSGSLTSGDLSWPQGQTSPSTTRAHRFRACISPLHSKQVQMQCSASSPHWPPQMRTHAHQFRPLAPVLGFGRAAVEAGARRRCFRMVRHCDAATSNRAHSLYVLRGAGAGVTRVYRETQHVSKAQKLKTGKLENWKSGSLLYLFLFVLMSIAPCDQPPKLEKWKSGLR